MSPFLFLIVAEGLNSLIEKATEKHLVCPARLGRDKIPISHLQYVDDTIFILDEDERNATVIKNLLLLFQFLSGLAVNFDKSSIMGISVNEEKVLRWANILKCKVGAFPCNYLGIKIGGRCNSIEDWNFLVDKVEKKIKGWKSRTLSLAGRITLIKSILQAIPVFQLSFSFIPKAVLSRIDSICCNFLWGEMGSRVTLRGSNGGSFMSWGEEGECRLENRGSRKGWWSRIVEKGGGGGEMVFE
ncbi:uncharacterized protein LOC130993778 [Salvia miltiorrhiza]|uniref:uncharacterized protein LOC130993778 n=1 Tax=Salvia miltiorrhiza TaxID=226208 RepID=UPI0025ABD8D2|nr:uncharacterized protein LOC130993778 [Salvia miltiorrhiza]